MLVMSSLDDEEEEEEEEKEEEEEEEIPALRSKIAMDPLGHFLFWYASGRIPTE